MTTIPAEATNLTASSAALTPLRRLWVCAEAHQRFLYGAAGLLLLSGVAHVGMLVWDGGALEGAVSWRKPITFGLSLGILLATLGWLLDAFGLQRLTGWTVAVALGASAVIETFLITMQTWRGVPSHFNESTPFDGAVFALMGVMIGVLVLATTALMVRSLGRLRRSPSRAWAARAGLVLLLLGQATGGAMIAAGPAVAAELKGVHAMGLHGLQAMLVLGWLLWLTPLAERQRTAAILTSAAAYLGLVGLMLSRVLG